VQLDILEVTPRITRDISRYRNLRSLFMYVWTTFTKEANIDRYFECRQT